MDERRMIFKRKRRNSICCKLVVCFIFVGTVLLYFGYKYCDIVIDFSSIYNLSGIKKDEVKNDYDNNRPANTFSDQRDKDAQELATKLFGHIKRNKSESVFAARESQVTELFKSNIIAKGGKFKMKPKENVSHNRNHDKQVDNSHLKRYESLGYKLVSEDGKIDDEAFDKWDNSITDKVLEQHHNGQKKYCLKHDCSKYTNTMIKEKSRDITDKFRNQTRQFTRTTPWKTILLWNDFFGMKDWEFGLGNKPFLLHKCPVSSCLVTNDRSFLNTSDAVLFHVNELNSNDRPTHRTEEQRWVFFNMESPQFQYWQSTEYLRWNGLFNWTMTYRQDSNVNIKYGEMIPRIPTKKAKPVKYLTKKKAVAWMVSNCKTPSKRWQLYQELSKYIPITIMGKCGNNTCDKTSEKCWKRLARKHKFYLSFENALCKDYITEKVWKPLKYGIVPIVYGLGNYSSNLPTKSYIDVNDFTSMKELAAFLKSFGNDSKSENKYRKYFQWKKNFKVVGYKEAYGKSWCDLCKKLHDDKEKKVYRNIGAWWDRDRDCQDPKKRLKLWNIQL